jgi:hypothetical protein
VRLTALGFAYVWNTREPGMLGIADIERNAGLVFQLLPSGKLYLLPHRVLVEDPDDLIAPEIRRRNPLVEVRSN